VCVREQFSALPGALTGREVLWMYARLRGVPSSHIERTVEDLLQRIDLAEYADRCASSPVPMP
jgi:ABC-type multidrug transport system ATPase subunit